MGNTHLQPWKYAESVCRVQTFVRGQLKSSLVSCDSVYLIKGQNAIKPDTLFYNVILPIWVACLAERRQISRETGVGKKGLNVIETRYTQTHCSGARTIKRDCCPDAQPALV